MFWSFPLRNKALAKNPACLVFVVIFVIIWFCGRCHGSEHSVFVRLTFCLSVCLSVCLPSLCISNLCHVTVGIVTNVCIMSPKEKNNETKLSGAVPGIIECVKSAVCCKVCQYLYH